MTSDAPDKAIEAATRGVTSLADALAKMAPDAWQALVLGHRVHGIAALILLVSISAASGLSLRHGLRNIKFGDTGSEDRYMPLVVIGGFLALISFVVLVIAGPDWATEAIAPQAATIKELAGLVK